MRNLKRILSMVLALTMLLGMVTTGVGAAETTAAEAPVAVTVGAFKDTDQITYTEEVSIMAGMGLFAGTTDGKFDPLGTVTRAQMVTVLVKVLRGNEFNANAFKGADVNPFPDTASFEGGWAEGYITAGHQMGIVGGYGDGTFKPGKAVTTAEALTMIINALGVDAGEGEWPSTIMAKAEEMKLYGNLKTKPATNDPMNREQLAVVTYEGMCYSPKGVSGYKVPNVDIVFTDIADAMKANGGVSGITEVVGEDALANQIYELKIAKGFVTSNQSTGHEQTTIRPVKGDGTLDVGVDYFVQTDLDMVGHYVTVYYKEAYKNEKEPGQVYTIVDETEVVEVKEDITTSRDYKAVFGKSYQLKDTNKVVLLDSEYNYTGEGTVPASVGGTAYAAGNTAPKGTYFIADNAVVGYMEPVTRYASYVSDISKFEGEEGVLIADATPDGSYISNAEGDDRIVEYRGMAVGDYVVYMKVQNVYVVEPVDPVQGAITKTARKEVDGVERDVITVDGTDYVAFPGVNNVGNDLSSDVNTISYAETYEIYITEDNEFVGFKSTGGIDLSDIVYVVGTGNVNTKDNYGDQIITTVARCVDMDGMEKRVVLGVQRGVETYGDPTKVSLTSGFYSVEDSKDKDDKKEGIQILTPVSSNYNGNEVFAVTSSTTAKGFYSSGYLHLTTSDGMKSFGKSGSKYIVVNGDMSSAALDIDVLDTLVNFEATKTQNFELLVSRAASGANNLIEVMIITGMTAEQVTSGTGAPIYVTAEQIDNASQNAEGYVYEVYNAADGTLTQITVDKNNPLARGAAGIYAMQLNDDGLATLTVVPNNGTVNNNPVYHNQGILGMHSGRDLQTHNSKSSLPYNSSASVKVVDVRSDDQIALDKTARITSKDQLLTLIEKDPKIAVVADLYAEKPGSDPNVRCIFITKIYRDTPGLKSIVYAFANPGTSGDDVKMVLVRSNQGAAAGKVIQVDYDATIDAVGEGFFMYCVNENGQPTLKQILVNDTSSGNPGTIGQHNLVTSVNVAAGTITTEDYHGGCSVPCLDQNEAVKGVLNVTEKTAIFGADGKAITLTKLAELVNAGQVIVNYYCADSVFAGTGATDNTPEAIFVCGAVETGIEIHRHNCSENHVGGTGDWTPLGASLSSFAVSGGNYKVTAGKYYLEKDIPLENYLYLSGDVTLCLNGHKLIGAVDNPDTADEKENAYIINTNTYNLDICDCSAEKSGVIGDNWASAGGTTNGAILVRANCTLNMYGGTITGVTGKQAVYVAGTFNMHDGTISGNTVSNDVFTAPEDTIKGLPAGIFNQLGGTVGDGGGTGGEPGGNEPGGNEPGGNEPGGNEPGGNEPGGGDTQGHTHANCTHTHVGDGEWISLNDALSSFAFSDGNYKVPTGKYYLEGDLILDGYLNTAKDVTLCLNGKTLDGSGVVNKNYIIRMDNSATGLDICDCSAGQSGKITGLETTSTASTAMTYSAIIVRKAPCRMYGGTITGNEASAAVFVANGATFEMHGGQIVGNTAKYSGQGAVHTQGATATVELYGGDISGNTVPNGVKQVSGSGSINNHIIPAHVHNCAQSAHVGTGAWKSLNETVSGFTASSKLPAGNYYLDANLSLDHYLALDGDVTLCLNGKTLTGKAGKNYIINTGKSHKLDICDCLGGGVIGNWNGSTSNTASAILVGEGATVNMHGGTISGVNSTQVVYIVQFGGFSLYGGEITGCTGNSIIKVDDGGTFTMEDGKISGNIYNEDVVIGNYVKNGGEIQSTSGSGTP